MCFPMFSILFIAVVMVIAHGFTHVKIPKILVVVHVATDDKFVRNDKARI